MHHRLVFLQITDPEGYARYRAGMEPLLASAGGRFVLDVVGAPTVHPADFLPDRVLLIAFPDPAAAEAFFADPAYQAVRSAWFTPSVAHSLAVPVS